MTDRAIIAGTGDLPQLLLGAGPALVVRLQGIDVSGIGDALIVDARVDRLAELFAALKAEGVTRICMAGAMTRANVTMEPQDPLSAATLMRIAQALQAGDDRLLREIIAIFEEQGFAVEGASDWRPDLVAPDGPLVGDAKPDGDAARARQVLAALGDLDVGQAAIAAKGQMLGIETLQGTDALLTFVAQTAPGSGGVLVKRAKPGQELRVDMPAIGPDTVRGAAAAGLSGIEVQAGHVLLLDPAAVTAACRETGIALWGAP